jgi:hypothetical protein
MSFPSSGSSPSKQMRHCFSPVGVEGVGGVGGRASSRSLSMGDVHERRRRRRCGDHPIAPHRHNSGIGHGTDASKRVVAHAAGARAERALLPTTIFSFVIKTTSVVMPATRSGAKSKTKKVPTRQSINLKGSTKLVTEFFKYAVNTFVLRTQVASRKQNAHLFLFSILFQRSVYPEDDFHMVKKYGQTVLVTQDLALESYLDK